MLGHGGSSWTGQRSAQRCWQRGLRGFCWGRWAWGAILLGTLGLQGFCWGRCCAQQAVCWQLIPRPISAATDRSHAKKRAGEVGKLSSLAPACRIAPPASSAELPIASCQRRRATPRTVSIWEAAGA